jgi:hypothetical protein
MYFYVSAKCWSGPSRLGGERPRSGMLISDAVVLTDVRKLTNKVGIAGNSFTYGCELLFEHLVPLGSGLSLSDIAPDIDLLSGRSNYGQALQRTPVLLSQRDADLFQTQLEALATPFENAVELYLAGE